MNLGVTVLICTYNGSSRLPTTLQYLAGQTVADHIPWQVLIVDNASTDNSAEVAQQSWQTYGAPCELRVIHQPVPGLNPAREMGFAQAYYEYIVVCDDDNWLSAGFVQRAFEIMHANPNIGILGGRGELVYEEPPPLWLDAYCIYASGPQAPRPGKVLSNRVYGAGSVVRKSGYDYIRKAGFESLLTDRMAAQLTSGGDHEFCYAFALAGYDIWYDEQLSFRHFIAKDRIDWNHYMRYIEESATCFEVLEPYKILVNYSEAEPAELLPKLARSFLYHLRRLLPTWWGYHAKRADSRAYHVNHIRHILLRTRLRSYYQTGGLKKLQQNFAKVKAYQSRLARLRLKAATPAAVLTK